MKTLFSISLIVLFFATKGEALTVDNSSFEVPDQGGPGQYSNYNNTTTAGWTFTSASNGAGIQTIPADGFQSAGTSTGVQEAWINLVPGESGTITSADNFTIVGGTNYILTVALGYRSNLAPSVSTISLIDTTTHSVLASNTILAAQLTPGTFTDFQAVLTPAQSALVAGDSMTIQLGEANPSGSFAQGNFDNVRLDESVPEPSTYAMIGFGLVGVVLLARRKMARL